MKKNHPFYDKFSVGKLNSEFAKNAGFENAYELDFHPLKNIVSGTN